MNVKKCVVVIVLFIFAITNSFVAFGSSKNDTHIEMKTGFEVEGYDNPDLEAFSSRIKLKLLTSDCNEKIDNYDVNTSGEIVVACNTISTEKKVCVYNSLGQFQYGYSLMDFGTIGVEWDGDNIIVYSVRSDYLILLDRKANVLDKKKVLNTPANNTYSHKILWETQREAGSHTYQLKTSKIIKNDTDGNESIIVDKSGAYYFHLVIIVLFVAFSVIEFTIVMIKMLKKRSICK